MFSTITGAAANTKAFYVQLAFYSCIGSLVLQWLFHRFLDWRTGEDWKLLMKAATPADKLAYYGKRWQGTCLISAAMMLMLGLVYAA